MTPPSLMQCDTASHITMLPVLSRQTGRTQIAPRLKLSPDIDQTRQFLKAIDPLAEKHFFQTFSDGVKNSSLIKQHFASLDDAKDELTRLNESEAGVFFTVNETNGTGRAAKDITRIRALYLDFDDPATAFDLVDSLTEKLTPSVIVESSPDKLHAYYLVSDLSTEDAKGWLTLMATSNSPTYGHPNSSRGKP